MPSLSDLRLQIQILKRPAASQKFRYFLPNGSLENLLAFDVVQDALSDPSFQVPPYKRNSATQTVIDEARKVFAVLVELKLEYTLAHFIENDTMDKDLPVDEKTLEGFLSGGDARDFVWRQWEYLAYNFRRGPCQRQIRTEIILLPRDSLTYRAFVVPLLVAALNTPDACEFLSTKIIFYVLCLSCLLTYD